MKKVNVIGRGYYHGERFPSITMKCTANKSCGEIKIKRAVSQRMREHDARIERVDITIEG